MGLNGLMEFKEHSLHFQILIRSWQICSATNTQEQNVNRENDNQPMEIHAASGKTPSKCQHEIDTDLEKRYDIKSL